MIVLETKLQAAFRGAPCARPYRAVIFQRKSKWIFAVEQLIGTNWDRTCGQWNLSTLLTREEPHDGLYIDYGQQWEITAGINEALKEAITHI